MVQHQSPSSSRGCVLASLVIGMIFFTLITTQNGFDPAVFISAGENEAATDHIVEQLGRDIPLRPPPGHDGQQFFLQALDPFFLGSTEHAVFMDRPLHRSQRVLYPAMIGLGGLAPPTLIPWLMGLVNVAAFGLGTWAVSRIAVREGQSNWLGLAFVLNIGLLMEFDIGGAGILAFALGSAAVAELEIGRERSAALLFVAAVLAKEVMLVFVAGALLLQWRRTRKMPFMVGAPAALAVGLWALYLRLIFSEDLTDKGVIELGAPFRGFSQAVPEWTQFPFDFLVVALAIVCLLWVIRQAVVKPSLMVWGAAGFAVLSVFFRDFLWDAWFNLTRAVAPVFSVFLYSVMVRSHAEEEHAPPHAPVSGDSVSVSA